MGWFGVLCNGSMAVFEELEAAGHDCELRQDGALTVARNAAEVKMARADYARLKSNGHDVVYLEGAEAVVTVEPALVGGEASLSDPPLPPSGTTAAEPFQIAVGCFDGSLHVVEVTIGA